MENLRTIKNRLKTIGSIIKAVNSMKMIATVKLARVNNTHKQAKACSSMLSDMLGKALRECTLSRLPEQSSWIKGCLLDQANQHGVTRESLIIVLSTNQGFCGSFNQCILHAASELIGKYDGACVEVFGKIGRAAIPQKRPVARESEPPHDMRTAPEYARYLSELVVDYIINYGVGSVFVVSGKFENILVQKGQVSTLWPVECNSEPGEIVKIEGDVGSFLNDLLHMYLYETFVGLVIEHMISEYSARVMTLDASVRNANDMFDRLQLQCNRIRQDRITQELTEIVSSIECML
ncbi:MAG: F0F1 ATP synthase subunit gamma [Holosporales bacterium]|jgi:F-type H+-transporting ATPase subunit gamma|nr:F0F1 ATP synthase subunit gamma [Holosporales bacterium]